MSAKQNNMKGAYIITYVEKGVNMEYYYLSAIKEDVKNYIDDEITISDFSDRDELENYLNDELATKILDFGGRLMSQFTSTILGLQQNYNNAKEIQAKIDALAKKLEDMNNKYIVMIEAQQLLATVSDDNTKAVLDYMTGIINKTLGELFPHDNRRIYLDKQLYRGQHAHINVVLTGSNGKKRDLTLQSGTGLRQVVSFLFVLCLIEIRKCRQLLVLDEMLSGLHPVAKEIVMDVVQIFAEEGFQFAMVEYGVNSVGKIYLVEKPDKIATVAPFDGVYNNELFVLNRPPENVDLSFRVNEEEVEV